MRKHLRYLIYVTRHRFWVAYYCFRAGLIWRGLKHDLSKYRPSEWRPYANFFYGRKTKQRRDSTGYYKPTDTGDPEFDFAWFLHQKRNDHHWQWWCCPDEDIGQKVFTMSRDAVREMICDWRGAGRAQGIMPEATPEWYAKNGKKMLMTRDTRLQIQQELARIFGADRVTRALVEEAFDEKLDALRTGTPLRFRSWTAYIDEEHQHPFRMVRHHESLVEDLNVDWSLDWQIDEPKVIEKTRRQMLGYVAHHPCVVRPDDQGVWKHCAIWNYENVGMTYDVMPIDEDGEQDGDIWRVRIVEG